MLLYGHRPIAGAGLASPGTCCSLAGAALTFMGHTAYDVSNVANFLFHREFFRHMLVFEALLF